MRAVKTFPQMMLFPIKRVPRNTSLPRNVMTTLNVTHPFSVVALGTRLMGIRNKPILVLCLTN